MSFLLPLSRPLGIFEAVKKFFNLILSKRQTTVHMLKEECGNETGDKQSSPKVTTIYDANKNMQTNEAQNYDRH